MLSNCNCIATLAPPINSSPSGAPALTSSLLSAGRCERGQIRSPRDKLNKKVGAELHSFARDAPHFQFFVFYFSSLECSGAASCDWSQQNEAKGIFIHLFTVTLSDKTCAFSICDITKWHIKEWILHRTHWQQDTCLFLTHLWTSPCVNAAAVRRQMLHKPQQ